MSKTTSSANRSPWPLILGMLLVLGVLGGCVYWQLQQGPQVAATAPAGEIAGPIIFGGEPRAAEPVTILRNKNYVVGYSEARRDPLWVAYRLTGGRHPSAPRPKVPFQPDLRTTARVTTHDYERSGYDRGHMAPSHAIGACFGPEAQLETFLMTNICPQLHTLNAGTWEQLEKLELDDFATRFTQVWIFDGPVFSDRSVDLRSNIQVPRAFYKIIVEDHAGTPQTLAFIMPQNIPSDDPPAKYLTSIQDIEGKTRIVFLWQLPKDVETKVKSSPARSMW